MRIASLQCSHISIAPTFLYLSYSSLSLHFIIKSREVSKARANVAEIVAVRINTYTRQRTNERERERHDRSTMTHVGEVTSTLAGGKGDGVREKEEETH